MGNGLCPRGNRLFLSWVSYDGVDRNLHCGMSQARRGLKIFVNPQKFAEVRLLRVTWNAARAFALDHDPTNRAERTGAGISVANPKALFENLPFIRLSTKLVILW